MRWKQAKVDCEFLDLSEVTISDLGGRKATVVTQHCLKPGSARDVDKAIPDRCHTCPRNLWRD